MIYIHNSQYIFYNDQYIYRNMFRINLRGVNLDIVNCCSINVLDIYIAPYLICQI